MLRICFKDTPFLPIPVPGIVIEPVQRQGGFYQAPARLMRELRVLCDEHRIVFVADEVQPGNLFAMGRQDVSTDITTMAKGLAGGLHPAAVIGRVDRMDAAQPGGLGGTYGVNLLGIATAKAVLDIIEEDLCARATELGLRPKQRLETIREYTPEIIDVLAPGLMIAIE